jgi:pimeloyl-ACP methyl ester carboxylesterase
MRQALIKGIASLLGSHLAARYLTLPETRVCYLATEVVSEEQIAELVFYAGKSICGADVALTQKEIVPRLRKIAFDADRSCFELAHADLHVDEVWYVSGTRKWGDFCKHGSAAHPCTPGCLVSAAAKLGASDFNYVVPAGLRSWSGSAPELQVIDELPEDFGEAAEHDVVAQCRQHKVGYRIFRSVPIIGDIHFQFAIGRNDFLQFLSVLHDLKREIEERLPDYFEFQALRCCAPAGATLNFIPADHASELLLSIARQAGTRGGDFHVASPEDILASDLCERVGIAYGVSLLTTADRQGLNAIDRTFDERLGGFCTYLTSAQKFSWEDAYRIAGFSPEKAILNEPEQVALFEGIRSSQDTALARQRESAANFPARLVQKTIQRNTFELTYYVGGTEGPPVILLNALGQGLQFWYRLMDRLMQSHRLIIWEPRGTVSPPPPFGISDQVDDLAAVLENEDIDACHLVGWCTGPKVAIEFYLRHPAAVLSVVCLNSTFKCVGSPEELDSSYEENLESLCRVLVKKPAMASSVMNSLQSGTPQDELDLTEESDSERLSSSVLSLMNADLKSHVLAPFQSEATTVNYAHQLIDFWSHDIRPKASEVQIPMLLIASEYDQIASPATSQMAVELFPNARCIQIPGATHYCLYDRPDLIAGLLEAFFQDPGVLQNSHQAQGELAYAGKI